MWSVKCKVWSAAKFKVWSAECKESVESKVESKVGRVVFTM